MSDLIIKNGVVFDPINNIDGEKKEIHIKDGKIVAKVNGDAKIIDASGMIVMPGGVDIHSHIAGAKVNVGRALRPEDKVPESNEKRTKLRRAGTGFSVPSTWVTGYRYARLGFTTVIEPAMPLLEARHTHEEFLEMPIIDKAAMPIYGNNWFVLKYVREGDLEKLAAYINWILKATKGYAIKIVNPGGVENWAWGKNCESIDDPVVHWDVTPRMIVESLAKVNEMLQLPHSIHVHCNNLGHPGNYKHSIETFKLCEGIEPNNKNGRERSFHVTHCQFNAYGGSNWGNFESGASEIAEYVNSHNHMSLDCGQVVFTKYATTTMTGDGPWEFALHHLGGMSPWGAKPGVKWVNGQIEGESGSGIVPYFFSPQVGVNAVQWAIGLELMLLIKDPWKLGFTTDHPNGGPFTCYPQAYSWLMDGKVRAEMLKNMSNKASSATSLPDIDREYTLNELCIITRAGTAKLLGMRDRGHLGVGAIGDVAVYNLDPTNYTGKDIEKAFTAAAYTIKDGQIVVKDGEVTATPMGTLLCAEGKVKESTMEAMLDDVKASWRDHYSINFNNYAVQDVYAPKVKIVNGV
ncbi:MAG: formylmethanofuran dehydrogenase subunit A [Candidatus Lokiarchaeota archaeon]|nr:formylmethanofuran dehydrogenase subunit A [Candidatus Lokiarchaeota archaeon]